MNCYLMIYRENSRKGEALKPFGALDNAVLLSLVANLAQLIGRI